MSENIIPTKEKAVEFITHALPYGNHIEDLDFSTSDTAIRFTWRGNRFRLTLDSIHVEEVGEGVLMGSDMAILVEHILKHYILDNE